MPNRHEWSPKEQGEHSITETHMMFAKRPQRQINKRPLTFHPAMLMLILGLTLVSLPPRRRFARRPPSMVFDKNSPKVYFYTQSCCCVMQFIREKTTQSKEATSQTLVLLFTFSRSSDIICPPSRSALLCSALFCSPRRRSRSMTPCVLGNYVTRAFS